MKLLLKIKYVAVLYLHGQDECYTVNSSFVLPATFPSTQLDKVLAIMYGACVATRNHAVADAGWQQQQHTEDATPEDAGAAMFDFEQTRSKDGKLSAQEFVEATTKFPQV